VVGLGNEARANVRRSPRLAGGWYNDWTEHGALAGDRAGGEEENFRMTMHLSWKIWEGEMEKRRKKWFWEGRGQQRGSGVLVYWGRGKVAGRACWRCNR